MRLRVQPAVILILTFTLCIGTPGTDAGQVRKERKNLVILSLSAHPDDEDGGVLAVCSRIKGATTYGLFFTRGEGGQNETGSQLYEDLAAVRTTETENAASILGSKAYFLGFSDFGYSKTADETFRMWGGKDSVLARLVYFIRALKPDVIFTNHDTVTTKPFRQHGNHQVVGLTAVEAFTKAADPAFHPEQITEDITPWQTKRLYCRSYARDSLLHLKGSVTVLLAPPGYHGPRIDSLMLTALRQHHSQGMGKWTLDSIPAFFRTHSYRLIRHEGSIPADTTDMLAGIEPSIHRSAKVSSYPVPLPTRMQHARPEDLNVHIPSGVKIGLISTYDTTVVHLLGAFHIAFDQLDSVALDRGNLSQYSTIIIDLRAYAYRPDLVRNREHVLEYVHGGGNCICFYHKSQDWNPLQPAPYPLVLTGDRVTEEDAAVTCLDPAHPFFSTPNTIGPHDWDGWVQERSIYLPDNDTTRTSARYRRLLAMHDTNENQPPTALLWAPYGKGTYTYCALVLYRQLRVLNIGAVELFLNMISSPHH